MIGPKEEDHFKLLIKNSSDLIYELDADGKYLYANQALLDLLAYTLEELKSMTCWELIPEEYAEEIKNHYLALIKSHQPSESFEIPVLTKNGKQLWVNQSVHYQYEGTKVSRAFVIARNITTAKIREEERNNYMVGLKLLNEIQANHNLGLSEQLYEALELCTKFLGLELGIISEIESSNYYVKHYYPPEAALSTDDKFETSETFCEITLAAQEVTAFDLTSAPEYKSHPCYEKFQLETYIGEAYKVAGKVVGTLNFSSTRAKEKPFGEYEKAFVSLLAKWVGSAIERQQIRENLVEQNDRLKTLNEEKDKLIAIIGHDLRNPISAIKSFSELIIGRLKAENSALFKISEAIHLSSQKSLDLIEKIINWGTVATQTPDRKETVYFKQLTDNILDLFKSNIDNKGLTYSVEYDENHIECNRMILELILRNLISNAIKYTPNKGKFQIKLNTQTDHYLLQVVDSGIGIEQKATEKILQMDHKISTKGTNEEGGTGLGLKLCLDAINKVNGKIEIDSVINSGTKFNVTFPR